MSMQDATELKGLQTQLTKKKTELDQAYTEQKEITAKINSLRTDVAKIEGNIQKVMERSKDIIVSEHAIIRYLERVRGFDMEDVRREMIMPSIEPQIKTFRSGTFPGPRCKLRVKNNVVMTVITKDDDAN